MSKDYDNEIGYETLLSDFRRYNKQAPKGVKLAKKGQNIYLQFKTTNKARAQYACSCTFTLDGMVEALSKAHKVAEKLKESSSESEFWQWHDSTIKEAVNLQDNVLTFSEAISVVEEDFWRRPSKTKRKRDRQNPSDISSWDRTYGTFYKYLPDNEAVNLVDVLKAVDKQKRGTKNKKYVVTAMRKLARMIKRQDILEALGEVNVIQTETAILQSVTLDEFFVWRNKVLGIASDLNPRINLDNRRAWLWVFSMQVVYGLRLSETFAIKNLDKPYIFSDGVTIPALNDPHNTENLIYIGEKTNLGTTVKTGSRLARPNIPPKHPNLIEALEIKAPLVPANTIRSTDPLRANKFYTRMARQRLVSWDAPTTQTHAFRHLANINGMQAGISLEVRAQSLGHTPAMNDSVYKKRQHTQTTIDLLLHSNVQAIDFVTALNEAKRLVKDGLIDKEGCALLMAKIYQKDSSEIIKLL